MIRYIPRSASILQLLAGVGVVRSVADDEHGGQLTGVGKIDDVLAVADKAGLIVVAGDFDAVVDHQLAVSNQYPFAVHPGGQSHRILVGHIFDRTEHRAVGADDFIENIGEHSVGVAHHAGSVQDDRVDLALVKRFDTVQDDVRRTEEVLGIQHDRLGAGEGIHRSSSRIPLRLPESAWRTSGTAADWRRWSRSAAR